jgi:hypothetical protein
MSKERIIPTVWSLPYIGKKQPKEMEKEEINFTFVLLDEYSTNLHVIQIHAKQKIHENI